MITEVNAVQSERRFESNLLSLVGVLCLSCFRNRVTKHVHRAPIHLRGSWTSRYQLAERRHMGKYVYALLTVLKVEAGATC